jgi:membrane fusion protein, multidrug efflux system
MKRRTLLILGAPVVVMGMLLLYGIMRRDRALSELTRVSEEQAALPVQIVTPARGPSARALTLPGTVRAWYEAPIFAQV